MTALSSIGSSDRSALIVVDVTLYAVIAHTADVQFTALHEEVFVA